MTTVLPEQTLRWCVAQPPVLLLCVNTKPWNTEDHVPQVISIPFPVKTSAHFIMDHYAHGRVFQSNWCLWIFLLFKNLETSCKKSGSLTGVWKQLKLDLSSAAGTVIWSISSIPLDEACALCQLGSSHSHTLTKAACWISVDSKFAV